MQGIHYIHIFYPGSLLLNDGIAFHIDCGSYTASLLINRHITGLDITDLGNKLIKKESGYKVINTDYEISKKNLALDLSNEMYMVLDNNSIDHRVYKPCWYTEIILSKEIPDMTNIPPDSYKFYIKPLEKFISWYRYISKDPTIIKPQELVRDAKIIRECIIPLPEEERTLSTEKRLSKERELDFIIKEFNFQELLRSRVIAPPICHNSQLYLSKILSDGVALDLAKEFISKAAEEAYINKNYRYALLDSIIAAEIALSKWLIDYKINRGVSKSKIKDYDDEVGLSYKLNIELISSIPNLTEKDKKMIGMVNSARKIRNEIVHEGRISVSEEEVLNAINSVDQLILLLERISTST